LIANTDHVTLACYINQGVVNIWNV